MLSQAITIIDPLSMLASDHEHVRHLFKRYQETSRERQRHDLARYIFQELKIHSILEEEIFYPAIRQQGGAEGEKQVEAALGAHEQVERLIQQLERIDSASSDFDHRMQELHTAVLEHARKEEAQIFPIAQQHLSLNTIGARMAARKGQLLVEQTLSPRGMWVGAALLLIGLGVLVWKGKDLRRQWAMS